MHRTIRKRARKNCAASARMKDQSGLLLRFAWRTLSDKSRPTYLGQSRSEERRVGKTRRYRWRHTRSTRDWSSDVCSSDLQVPKDGIVLALVEDVKENVHAQDDSKTGPQELRCICTNERPKRPPSSVCLENALGQVEANISRAI